MFYTKKVLSKLSVSIVVIAVILYFLYRFFATSTPSNWQTYEDTTTHHQYSFSYPKNWVLTECGNGEVVVGKAKIANCMYPLEASKEYWDNVYFQTFMPGDKSSQISFNQATPPAQLADWSTVFFSFDDGTGMLNEKIGLKLNPFRNMAGNAFPVKFDSKYDFVYDDGTHHPNKLSNFTVGFYPHPELKNEYLLVKKSLEYNYK